ncbi:MAG: hypothetical protein QM817_37400 [Archangium sp.]
MRRPSPSALWIPFIALIGAALGHLLLPMRWWRHGDLPLTVPLLLLTAIALSLSTLRWIRLLPFAICAWLGWALALTRLLLWISTWNTNVLSSALVWGGTVVIELALLIKVSKDLLFSTTA